MTILSFDLDDTLWPCPPVIAAAEAYSYPLLRDNWESKDPLPDLEQLRLSRQEYFAQHPERIHDLSHLRQMWVAERFGHAVNETVQQQYLQAFLNARNWVHPYADVDAALAELAKHHRLIAFSNGNADVFATSIGKYFDHAFSAEVIGAAKPSKTAFGYVLKQLGVSAAGLLHIGDNPIADVQGAQDMGIKAVWNNRLGEPWTQPRPPEFEIQTIDQLIPLLRTL